MRLSDDPPDQLTAESALYNVVVSTASVVGDEYFTVLARVLAHALNTTSAFVAEVTEQPRGLMLAMRGINPHAVIPDLAVNGLAIAPASHGGFAFVPCNARESFPDDRLLELTRSDACLAIPVSGTRSSVIGVVGLLDRTAIAGAFPGESVLRLVAARVGAEIERRRAVEESQTRSRLLREMTDRSQDIILRWRVKPELMYEYVSPSLQHVLGYKPEEFYADPEFPRRIIDPELRAQFAALQEGDDTVTSVGKWVHRDGHTVWTEGRRTAIRDDSGEVVAFESFTRDITAQREAEIALAEAHASSQRLLDAIPDTVFRVTSAGIIVDYRPPHGEPVVAPRVGASLEESLPAKAASALREAINSRHAHDTQSLRFTLEQAGLARTVEARVVASAGDDVVVFVRDVTGDEWLAHEVARHRTRDQLEGAAERRLASRNAYALTFREFTVLDLMRSGSSDKEIGTTLGISASTASKHVSNILAKMDAASRTEAVARAMSEGLLD